MSSFSLNRLMFLAVILGGFMPENAVAAELVPAEGASALLSDSDVSSADGRGTELTERGRSVRGVYAPVPLVRKGTPITILDWLKRVGANGIIVDIKDDRGNVTFTSQLPYATRASNGRTPQMAELVRILKENGIYVIGRLVCFKDTQLALSHPEAAIIDRRTGKPWRDRSKLAWTDPHSPLARAHIVRVARAAQELGFDEIQLDYVRFPVEPASVYARFPNREGKTVRSEVIAKLLADVDAAISIPLSIDVFGLTAYHSGDVDGLGQWLEILAPHIDAISPMVYLANWPKRYWAKPSHAITHDLVSGAVKRIRERLGEQIAVRPLLQGFQWRAEQWGKGFLVNQINAATNGGSSGFLFWNQGGSYGLLSQVLQDMSKKSEDETALQQ